MLVLVVVSLPVFRCRAATIVSASRGPMPGTSAISSGLAAVSLRTEPNCLSRAARRAGPSPAMSSSALAVKPWDRFCRW